MALTKINRIDADWVNVKNKCRTTVGKEYTENVPDERFRYDLLISEHSPIRLINVDWSWKQMKSWVSVHFVRHKWEKFVSTRRTDRTGVDRNALRQDEPVDMDGYANAQSLIDTARKRLCFQASPETREYMEDLKCEIEKREPELADVLVPNCVYRCGCPEFKSCGYWDNFKRTCEMHGVDISKIKERYAAYNDRFDENHR